MACEQKAKTVLRYLENEETVLKNVKEAVEYQLMRLQIEEMSLRATYQNLKSKQKAEKKNGMKVKKELKVKTEVKSPERMINSNIETELKSLNLDTISETKGNDEELPELLLEPRHLEPFSKTKTTDEELPELLLDPIFSYSKSDVVEISDQLMEPIHADFEGNSMDNSENSPT